MLGVLLLARLLIVSNRLLNMLLNALLLSALNNAPVFMACLELGVKLFFSGLVIPSLLIFLIFFGVTS